MEIATFLQNNADGQLKDVDENPAVPPNFKKKENKEYQQIMNKFIDVQKKGFAEWRYHDLYLHNLIIIKFDKYIPLGLNIDLNYKEIFIKNLQINYTHEFTYIKLKIASKICIYNYVIFLGEDANKDLIPISIYNTENYYSLNLDEWDKVQEFYKEGKYILIINPNYIIYDEKMYETQGTDGLLCRYPNETILFKDEKDIERFFNLLKLNNFESFKSLGDIMIMRKFYDKAIFFYEKALKNIGDKNQTIIIKIYSLLCECNLRYKYYTKALDYINKCFDLLDIFLQENKIDDIDKTFIMTSIFRKIKCFVKLRNFQKAYDVYKKIKDKKNFQEHYKLDENYINEFFSKKDNNSIIKMINIGIENNLGKYNIKQMLIEEQEKFYLDNGDYLNPKVEISFDSNKGIKMIAKEDIKIGVYILVEKAIYLCRTHDPNNNFETYFKLKYPFREIINIEYIDSINNLIKIIKRSPLDYKNFFILYNGSNLEEDYESRKKKTDENISKLNEELIEKIFKLNCYKTYREIYSTNRIGVGLWQIFPLFNHSCVPNTTNFGIGDFIFLMPNKLIKKGEEITVLYLCEPLFYKDRKNFLQKTYNFECKCDKCEIEKKLRENNLNVFDKFDDYISKFVDFQSSGVLFLPFDKTITEFLDFVDKNKNILSEYDIGNAYIYLSLSNCDFKIAYKYFKLAYENKLLDFGAKRFHLNKLTEIGHSLIQQGVKQILNEFKELRKTFLDFHKLYYNFQENEMETLVNINAKQKIKDISLGEKEGNPTLESALLMKSLNHLNKK